ncbi:MAG TPA: LytTR family DNA-binding domain-containing protein [Bacteroidia bacterium]|jgi:DNA-binding LytR/AlgR family response regulator|nr:LytTR family DNA-binding domain-containing protein [Bacteroidia bacterium]
MDCIIVEDNEVAAFVLQEYIKQNNTLNLKAVFDSGEAALKYLETNHCHLLFLDIELNGITGIDLIKQLTNTPNIVVTSSKSNYAAEAFDFDVADYLVKPFTYQRFEKALAKVNKIKESLKSENQEFFYLKQNGKMMQVFFKDVEYIEAMSDYVDVHTANERYVIYSTMKAMESHFPENEFVRVHRSFIVRIDKIKEIRKTDILVNGKEIPISRANKDVFLKKINLL